MLSSLLLLAGIPLLSAVSAAIIPSHDTHAHDHDSQRLLPDRWYHRDDHPVHALFRRQTGTPTDPPAFPQVGTPAWAAAYPVSTPDSNAMPQSWKDALNNAVQAGKIPNYPPSKQSAPGTNPTYGTLDPHGPQVCSGTYGCRVAGQIWDGPQGVVGISFDDGPLPPSDKLYAFLQQNQVRATHFYIGVNIIQNWKEFNIAFTNQDDIAVHTWTHPYMTTLSNADVVAQLGWTLQVIYNSTGGRLARFWRPPYGDTDTRVTAIAKEVFGLTTVVWNQDTGDWSLGSPGGTNPQAIQSNFQRWLSGPKNPGLIILEHELSDGSVQAFMAAYPLMKQTNWTLKSVAELDGQGAYQNVKDDTSPPTLVALTAGGNGGAGLVPSTSSTSTQPSPTSSSSSSSPSSSPAPDNGVKSSSASPRWHSPRRLTLSVAAMALVNSLWAVV